MKRIAFFLFALLVCGNIWSQAATNIELFTIDDVVIEPNGTATIYVATKNLESYELKGGQFYIYLPAGISVNEITVYDEEAEEEVKYPDISLVGTYNKNDSSYSRNNYTFAVTHGTGGGIYTGATVNRNERWGAVIDGVDCIIVGHTHKGTITRPSKIVIDSNREIVSMKDYLVISCVSWQTYGEYAMRKMLLPNSSSNPQKLTLSDDSRNKNILITW